MKDSGRGGVLSIALNAPLEFGGGIRSVGQERGCGRERRPDFERRMMENDVCSEKRYSVMVDERSQIWVVCRMTKCDDPGKACTEFEEV